MDLWLLIRAEAVAVSPFVGSFASCFIDRVPRGVAFMWSRSKCDHCQAELSVRDLVPILSYLALRGKCRKCKIRIPARLIQAEIGIGVLTAGSVWVSAPYQVLGAVAFAWLLFGLAQYDRVHGRLPDVLTAILCVLGLSWSLLYRSPIPPLASLAGASSGFFVAFLVARSYRLVAHRDGLGGGDIKLFGASGAWIGWEALPSLLLIASVTAILLMVASGRTSRLEPIAFGPFIVFGTYTIWCWQVIH